MNGRWDNKHSTTRHSSGRSSSSNKEEASLVPPPLVWAPLKYRLKPGGWWCLDKPGKFHGKHTEKPRSPPKRSHKTRGVVLGQARCLDKGGVCMYVCMYVYPYIYIYVYIYVPPPPCPSPGVVQAPPPWFYAMFWEVILVFRCVSHEISRACLSTTPPGFMRYFRSKPTSKHHPPGFMRSFSGA